jgi:FkbM family methyltransferase
MNVFSLLKFIVQHPLNQNNKLDAIARFVKWQISARLMPYPLVYQFTDRARLIIRRGMTGATGNFYCGLHEFTDMGFLLHFLRKEDFFVDIGANVGTYTVLASGHIGADTFSFEPVPQTFAHLVSNVSINQIQSKVKLFNIALGSSKGTINFTSGFDTMNHVATTSESGDSISVPVETLDDVLVNHRSPFLLKIDVEGFETEVIKGGTQTLKNEDLKAIIIELNGSGARYGYDETNIHNTLLSLRFKPYHYDPTTRSLSGSDTFDTHNTIYIRDVDFVRQRVLSAPKVKIRNTEV